MRKMSTVGLKKTYAGEPWECSIHAPRLHGWIQISKLSARARGVQWFAPERQPSDGMYELVIATLGLINDIQLTQTCNEPLPAKLQQCV